MYTTGDTDTKPNRRTILGAVGTLLGTSTISGRTRAADNDCRKGDPAAGGRTSSLMCGEIPTEHHGKGTGPWYESSITFQNCSTCTRLINTRITKGHIHKNNEEEPHKSDQTGFLSYHIGAGERKTFWYTGSINGFDISEPADMNVAISQRSIEHAEVPHCYRSSDDSDSTMSQDDECPEGNPAGGRTSSPKCGELPKEHHEEGTDPWYESESSIDWEGNWPRITTVTTKNRHLYRALQRE